MKHQELFEKTVGILVKAYQNDTLMHGNCMACAVGNIVAANLGICDIQSRIEWYKKAVDVPDPCTGWPSVFMTGLNSKRQRIDLEAILRDEAAKLQIESTGYTWKELAKIEYAFETAPKGNSVDEWMFNGLLAVYDVLCEIHEVSKDEVKSGELVFVK
jgi:hypothetical protein